MDGMIIVSVVSHGQNAMVTPLIAQLLACPDVREVIVTCNIPDASEIEPLVTAEVGGSALFASRFRECAARALLLGWRGDLLWNGEPLEYSVENAKTMLAVKDFRRWVFERAEDIDRFKAVPKDADTGK